MKNKTITRVHVLDESYTYRPVIRTSPCMSCSELGHINQHKLRYDASVTGIINHDREKHEIIVH